MSDLTVDPKLGDGGEKSPGKNGPGADPTKDGGKDPAKESGDKGSPGEQVITAERLNSVLDARQRIHEAGLKKFAENQDALTTKITELTERLAAVADGSSKKKKADDSDKSAEGQQVIELRRELDQMKSKHQEALDRANKESKANHDNLFQQKVKDALTKAGCLDTENGFFVIKQKLSESEEGNRIFATVKTEYGEEDLDLDQYIEREFAENICPYLFKGKMKSGSPAGGDDGGGGGVYQFTKEQLLDNPEEYAKDPEKARSALERNQVKGVRRGEGHPQMQ